MSMRGAWVRAVVRACVILSALLLAALAGCSSGGGGGGGGMSGTSGGNCAVPGASCTDSSDCCQSGANVNPGGARCISDDWKCHSVCNGNSDCVSGCCVGVEGVSYGVCAAASYCSCRSVGESCTQNSDCCQKDALGDLCIGSGIDQCTAKCYKSGDCASNCCVALENQSYGACLANSKYPCM
jgi:hypothetical protein